MARVELTEEAREDLADLDGSARAIVLKALGKLRNNASQRGAPLGSRPAGDLTGFRKLIVGNRDYRIVYRVSADGNVTVVWVIAKRADNEVYDMAVARLRLHPQSELTADMLSLLDDVWDR